VVRLRVGRRYRDDVRHRWDRLRHLATGEKRTAWLEALRDHGDRRGLPVAALVEYVALHAGFWAYDPSMPMLFGLGIFPLLQLIVLSLLALALSELVSRRTHDNATGP